MQNQSKRTISQRLLHWAAAETFQVWFLLHFVIYSIFQLIPFWSLLELCLQEAYSIGIQAIWHCLCCGQIWIHGYTK